MWYIYIYTELLLSLKKNGVSPLAAAWMHLEDTRLSEISQAKMCCVVSLIYGL